MSSSKQAIHRHVWASEWRVSETTSHMGGGGRKELQQLCHIWVYMVEGKEEVSATPPSAGGARRRVLITTLYGIYGRNESLEKRHKAQLRKT